MGLTGCALSPKSPKGVQDGPPKIQKNVAKIPNAIPKVEPKSRYGNPKRYEVFGKTYTVLNSSKGYKRKGIASWYGTKFHGRRTSSGEPYDLYQMTAAHKSLPLPTYVEVKNLENNKQVIVKVNDRGPFVDNRLIDLSYAAAKKLGVVQNGTAHVKITAIDPKKWQKKNKAWLKAHSYGRKAPPQPHYYIQLGAFQSKENAYALIRQVKKSSLDSNHKPFLRQQFSGGKGIYRVRMGPLNQLEALRLKKKLASIMTGNPTLVPI